MIDVLLVFESVETVFNDFHAFVTAWVLIAGGIGMASKSMAIGALGAFMMFAHFAIETGDSLLQNILMVTLVLVFVGFAFKLVRAEFMGGVES